MLWLFGGSKWAIETAVIIWKFDTKMYSVLLDRDRCWNYLLPSFVVVLLSLSSLIWLSRLDRFSGVRFVSGSRNVEHTPWAPKSRHFVFTRVKDVERIAQRVWNWLWFHYRIESDSSSWLPSIVRAYSLDKVKQF